MSKTLYIYGCSGIGKSIVDSVTCSDTIYDELIFVDDDDNKQGQEFYGCKVISRDALLLQAKAIDDIIIAFFKPADIFTRTVMARNLGNSVRAKFVTIIDQRANISQSAVIGEGVYVAPNVVVDSDANIGNYCVILFNSVVSREVVLASSTFLSAGVVLKGSVQIAESCFISAKAVITKSIHANVFVNASVTVTEEVQESCIISQRTQTDFQRLNEDKKRAQKQLRFFHP